MVQTKTAVGGGIGAIAAAGFVALGALLGMPSTAMAQNYVCPATLGPGERMVGMSQGGYGAPPVPLCTQDATPGSSGSSAPWQAGPEQREHDNFLAAAWHDESSNAWISAGYRNRGSAERAARNACNRAMGGQCRLATWSRNGGIAIARGDLGDLWAAAGNDEDEAESEVQRACREAGNVCVVFNRVWASGSGGRSEVFSPEGDFHRRYGAAAWTDTASTDGQWNSTVWLSGGHSTREQAEREVLAGCQNDSGQVCKVVKSVSDVNITVALDETGAIRVNAAAHYDQAVELAKERCLAGGAACQVKWVWSAVRDETVSLDIATAPSL